MPALTATGLAGVHLHDLRHTGNHLTADEGANLRELMTRMGHDSTAAALTYLHSTTVRQRALADAVGKTAPEALGKSTGKPQRSGTRMAHNQGGKS